jgi:hypothetical protein
MKVWAVIVVVAFINVIVVCLALGVNAIFIEQPAINDTTGKQLIELNYRLSIIEQDVDNINNRLSDADIQSMRWKLMMIESELSKMQGE